jgi:hypothetical protein
MVLDLKEKPANAQAATVVESASERGLPAIFLVLIVALVLGGTLAVYLFSSRPAPTSSGSVLGYQAVPIHNVSARSIAPGQMGTLEGSAETTDRILATVNVSIRNATDKIMYIKDAQVEVTPATGDAITDEGAPGSDYPRIFEAYPVLKNGALEPVKVETKIAPGSTLQGTILVGFTMKKDVWDARKSLKAVINLYDHAPLVLDVPPASGSTAELPPEKPAK